MRAVSTPLAIVEIRRRSNALFRTHILFSHFTVSSRRLSKITCNVGNSSKCGVLLPARDRPTGVDAMLERWGNIAKQYITDFAKDGTVERAIAAKKFCAAAMLFGTELSSAVRFRSRR